MGNQIPLLSGALGGIALFATYLHAVAPADTAILSVELGLSLTAGSWIGWEVRKAIRNLAS